MFLSAQAEDQTAVLDNRHKTCLEQIAEDADLAYEEAMIWRDDGGGRRARHCEAMALFALGHKEQAAYRLDQLGAMEELISPEHRQNYYLEAANFWLMAEETQQAYQSATAGLDIDEKDVGLRIARARVYALLERYEDSEVDLNSALGFAPSDSDALRYRADVRRRLGKLDAAKADIEKSLVLNPTSVETALIRGEINEAIRKRAKGELTAVDTSE